LIYQVKINNCYKESYWLGDVIKDVYATLQQKIELKHTKNLSSKTLAVRKSTVWIYNISMFCLKFCG